MLKRSGGRLAALGCLVLFGCARSPAKAVSEPVGVSPAATLAPAAVTSGPHSAAASTPKGPAPVEWPELVRHFAEAQVTGTVALYDTRDGVLGCSNLEKCGQAYLPASTYKIPHSMIALETGVVAGADTVFPWDKQQYQVANWNQNLTFRDAFRYSCVPCYQAIARQVGEAREQTWVSKLDYGNHDVSGGVDKFWLWGGLRVTPLQQLDFLRRFDGGRLPIAKQTAETVRDLMTLEATDHHVLRAKTGSAMPPQEAHEAGWFVGWVELGERRVFFALLIDSHAEGVDVRPLRRSLTERVLAARGVL